MTAAVPLKLDRLLLGVYLVALLGLLALPMAGSGYRLLGVGIDKWVHGALFLGLAVFLRWNLAEHRHAVPLAVAGALLIGVVSEAAQLLLAYRTAEWSDVLADFIGAGLGAVAMNRVMASGMSEATAGLVVFVLGLMIGALFILADVIGLGTSAQFGTTQMVGTLLGASICLGGAWLYARALRVGDARL